MLHPLSRAALAAALAVCTSTAQDIRLVHGSFDPTTETPDIVAALRGNADTKLWIVQFDGLPTENGRAAVRGLGAQVHGYLPDNAYVVRMDGNVANAVRELGAIRSVSSYHPAFRLEPALRRALGGNVTGELIGPIQLGTAKYNIVVVDKHNDKPALIQRIRGIGGQVIHEQEGSILLQVQLTPAQLQQAANFDEVLWIDRWSAPETDMDNVRIQGGGNYVEAQTGYTGQGLNAHIYEGIDVAHPGFSGPVVNVNSGGNSTGHGTNTAGIVFGDGTGNPQFRGMAPDMGKFYTNYSSVSTSRWQVVSDLVNVHDVSLTTASWGGARTRAYTADSADSDDIIFDHDIAWTQSQSNAGNQDSRPQAWAKNIFSIGGVRHFDNADPSDDSWSNSGSTGPAADGRIKPTLCAFYDNIGTTSQGGGYTTSFGGTSGATPIVAGHNAIAIQMFTDGAFGNTVRNPGGSRHSNRPHFTTLKCLQVANASQYSFNAASTDNRREHCGWGFPDIRRMWDSRGNTLMIDETDVMTQGQTSSYNYSVASGQNELKIVMSYSDPAANPSANPTRINDLSLRVTSPGGTVYWGNNGLEQGNWSSSGGSEDNINTTECVFVNSPQAGSWTIEVIATLVAQDSHVETPAVDADYALVASYSDRVAPVAGNFTTFGNGCPGSVPQPPICYSINPNGGTLASSVSTLEYCYPASVTGSSSVTSFSLFTQSSGGTVSTNAALYPDAGGVPSPTPIATTTMSVGATPGFYTATFSTPVPVTGTFYVGVRHDQVERCTLTGGTPGIGYFRTGGTTGSWSQSGVINFPSLTVTCAGSSGGFADPVLTGGTGSPSTGSSYSINLALANPNAVALSVYGFSDTVWGGGALPTPVAGAPGCNLLVSPDSYGIVPTDANGAASFSLNVPNDPSLVNFEVFHQWVVADPTVNSLGVVFSNGGKATIGNL